MSRLLDWLKTASGRILDPEREERVAHLGRLVAQRLREEKNAFQIDHFLQEYQVAPRDVMPLKERVYQMALDRVWEDRNVSEKEKASLQWVASRLGLDARSRQRLDAEIGRRVFEQALGRICSDGTVSEEEARELDRIAVCFDTTVRDLVRTCFRQVGEAFFRGLFATAVQDGRLTEDEWDRLLLTADRLGLGREELLACLQPMAEHFIEHALADAKADGELSLDEERALKWLCEHLQLSPRTRTYVDGQVDEMATLREASQGRLPSLSDNHVSLRAGEIVHFHGPARYCFVRQLKSGDRQESFEGVVRITDARLVFESPAKAFEVNHRKVIGIHEEQNSLQLRTAGRGSGNYFFGERHRVASAIYEAAVKKANQTLVDRGAGLPTRHIPRDVRQRVWQKYNGACANCGDTQYLEFDHIIPVAKGGSNSEANVQLLCRRCNLKKSDNI
ncbi:MAG: HNH endonuclease signature motif containing protein [Phycisphaerae bacterium]|nr:HNH endonuclease signature motif containing protein [Phycisphaerae bacterium]